MNRPLKTMKEFWPYYLNEHLDPRNRRLHFVGTLSTMVLFLDFLLSGEFFPLFMIPVFGYGFAWFGHFVFEKNRPATFRYPLKSLISDYIMFWMMLTGRLDEELKKTELFSKIP